MIFQLHVVLQIQEDHKQGNGGRLLTNLDHDRILLNTSPSNCHQ